MKKIYYTEKELILELQRFYKENKKVPVRIDMQKRLGYIDSNVFIRHFGSWNNALEIAGFKVNQKHLSTNLSKDEMYLIHELHRYVEKFGSVPKFDDLIGLAGFPSPRPYINIFGTWNNALTAAELPINHYNRILIGNEKCSMCGKISGKWRYDDEYVRYCPSCFLKPSYRLGKLNPNSNTGFAYIGQVVVRNSLGLSLKDDYNIIDNFNAPFDLYSDKYGEINVKCAKLYYSKIWNNSYWSFDINSSSEPDYYFLLGFSLNKQTIEYVWIVGINNEFVNKKSTVLIANSIKGLEKRNVFEHNAILYNDIYHSIDWNNDLFLSKSPLIGD